MTAANNDWGIPRSPSEPPPVPQSQPGQPPVTPPPGQAPTSPSPDTPAPVAPPAPPTGGPATGPSLGQRLAALPKQAIIGGGLAIVLALAGIGLLMSLFKSNTQTTTQQLDAHVPSAPQAIVPDGFTPPAPDATGRIIETDELVVDRELAEVTVAKVDPSTYAKVGEWWSRADESGSIYLPPGKTLADAQFFSAEDQTAPYAGQATEEQATVTSLTFEKGVAGGYNLSSGAQVWYQNETFQSDPAYILIPKGIEGTFQVYVGTAPIDLAIP